MKALTLKFDVSQMEDSSEQLEDFPGVILWEHENLQSWTKVRIFRHVIPALAAGAFTLAMSQFGSRKKNNIYLDVRTKLKDLKE